MRLIDADALREDIRKSDPMCGMNYRFFIKRAKTIDPCIYGSWDEISDEVYKCSVCGNMSAADSRYCCNCGAKMRQEPQDERMAGNW